MFAYISAESFYFCSPLFCFLLWNLREIKLIKIPPSNGFNWHFRDFLMANLFRWPRTTFPWADETNEISAGLLTRPEQARAALCGPLFPLCAQLWLVQAGGEPSSLQEAGVSSLSPPHGTSRAILPCSSFLTRMSWCIQAMRHFLRLHLLCQWLAR